MNPDLLPWICVLLPLAAALPIRLLGRWPNLREAVTFTTSGLLFYLVTRLVGPVLAGDTPGHALVEPIPGIALALRVEPLGMLFALIASGLWIVTSLFAVGYMRGNDEDHPSRFYMCFALAIFAALGIAFAANLFTLFVFYELLTFCTFPLVTHKGTPEARRSGRVYLGILVGTSVCFLMLGIIWTVVVAGHGEFTPGGVFGDRLAPGLVLPLLALFVFGIGKAATMPFHRWLPAAMVAPTPVSALLHAVAVVKAGVFAVLKIVIYIFGIDLVRTSGAGALLMWVAAFTILSASLVAMRQDNLKARLAYSTVSQLAYIVLGALLATRLSIQGGSLHMAMHAVGKITLFFCAGAIYVHTHKTRVSELDGLGRAMPLTFFAFLLGTLSIIGLPPAGGMWSKWYLMRGAADAGELAMMAVLMISSLLNVVYLLPIPIRAFLMPPPGEREVPPPPGHETPALSFSLRSEAPFALVAPPLLTGMGCILLFFRSDSLLELIQCIPLP